jgi:isocitrate dehydrogenase kinase/phosphatase
MEQTDWIYQGFDAGEARFLMVTAITHHRFSSSIWGEHEVRRLHGELAEIDQAWQRIQAAAGKYGAHLAGEDWRDLAGYRGGS